MPHPAVTPAPGTDSGSSVGSVLRRGPRLPAAVVWITVAHAGLLFLLAALFPVWRSPDEPAHVDMVRILERGEDYPAVGELEVRANVRASRPLVGLVAGNDSPPLAEADAPARSARPSFTDLAPDTELSDQHQQMAQHPPLYYAGLAAARSVVDVLPATGPDEPFDAEVTILRLLQLVLVVPLPGFTYLAARQVLEEGPAVAAAVLSVSIPMLAHVGSAVNNDNLLVALLAAMTPLALGLARGRGGLGHHAALGALGGAAVFTKGFALFVPLWIVVVAVGRARRTGRGPAVAGAAVALGTSFVAGGWWWARNIVVDGTVQPSGIDFAPADAAFTPDWGWWLGFAWNRLASRFWYEPAIVPTDVPVEQVVSVLGLALAGFGGYRLVRAHGWEIAAVLAVPAVAMFGILVYGAVDYYRDAAVPAGIHGRYLYGAVPGLAVLAAAAVSGRVRAARLAPWGALAAAVALQGVGLWWALGQYWAGEGARDRLASFLAWTPVPSGLLAVAALAVLAGLLGFWQDQRNTADP